MSKQCVSLFLILFELSKQHNEMGFSCRWVKWIWLSFVCSYETTHFQRKITSCINRTHSKRKVASAFASMEPQKLIFKLDMKNMPEHVRLSWFTMLWQDSVWFNPRFNLLVQMNFHNLFQTQCHCSACGLWMSVSRGSNVWRRNMWWKSTNWPNHLTWQKKTYYYFL